MVELPKKKAQYFIQQNVYRVLKLAKKKNNPHRKHENNKKKNLKIEEKKYKIFSSIKEYKDIKNFFAWKWTNIITISYVYVSIITSSPLYAEIFPTIL